MNAAPVVVMSCRRITGQLASQGAGVTYLQALREAGADPVLLPIGSSNELVERVVGMSDGLLLPGGEDVSPDYGGSLCSGPTAQSNDADRDRLELQLVRAARKHRKPIMGICRGTQLLNVAFGGKLLADIHDENPHALRHMGMMPFGEDAGQVRTYFSATHHSVRIEADSWLGRVFEATELKVNSFHHQAVDANCVGVGLQPCAWAADGTIEAIEGVDPDHFVVGVQWHPELLEHFGVSLWKTFFRRFVDVCR